ncbi:MAG: hypothetical protein L3J07_04410 [Candidatus Magasanikbacteria bacterium]|nr:hypothetical protein [Candidatus Magasanikbacteria bacterium]
MSIKKCRDKIDKLIIKSVPEIQDCIICEIQEVYDVFPEMTFADSSKLWKNKVATIFKARGVELRRVDEWGRDPFLVILTPEGLFSCPIVVGISEEVDSNNSDVIIAFRSMSSRRLTLGRKGDLDLPNSYPDWAKRKSEHYLWIKYAEQALDIIDTLDKKIPDIT